MSKKINLKDINFKDKKFIFPLIIAVIVLFIGWFIFGAIKDIKQTDQDETLPAEEVSEIQTIPIEADKQLGTKVEAMNDEFRESEDYTAMQNLYDATRITTDSTVYSAEELAYIDSLERMSKASQAEIDALNQSILGKNQSLSQDRKNLGAYEASFSSEFEQADPVQRQAGSDPRKELMEEMQMYQKLINGEEILTPEQEQAKKEEQIRMEERQKVMAELNAQATVKVEKASNINASAFNTVSSSNVSNLERNTFKAMVDQTIKVEQGSRVRFILLEDVKIGNDIVKKGSFVYGTVTGFQDQRIMTTINNILVNGRYLKVNLKTLDVDGMEGLYVPKSSFREGAKAAASQAVQGGSNMNITTSPESFTGMAVQALQNAYQSVTSAVSGNISKDKATIKYNTIVYLLDDEQK